MIAKSQIIFTICCFFILSIQSKGQTGEIINFGIPGHDALVSDGFVDSSNNIMTAFWDGEKGMKIGYFDQHFNAKWVKEFNQLNEGLSKIFQLENNDYFAFGNQSHMIRIDTNGNLIWHKEYDAICNISECVELSNGNILVVGKHDGDRIMACYDSNGNEVWNKFLSHPDFYNILIRDVFEVSDGNYLMFTELIGYPESRIVLSKFNAIGNIVWEKVYSYSDRHDYFQNGFESSSGDFYFIGSSYPNNDFEIQLKDVIVHKFNSTGTYLGGKEYSGPYQDEGYDLIEDDSGNIIATGLSKPVEFCGGNLMVLSLKNSLDTNFVKFYGTPSSNGAFLRNMHFMNGQIYAFGHGSLWSTVGSNDGHIIKTDSNFDLDCYRYQQPVTVSTVSDYVLLNDSLIYGSGTIPTLVNNSSEFSHTFIEDGCNGLPLKLKHENNFDFSLYPNPVMNSLNILLDENISTGELSVSDCTGQLLLFQSFNQTNSIELNVDDFDSGVYLVTIQSESQRITRKVIKN